MNLNQFSSDLFRCLWPGCRPREASAEASIQRPQSSWPVGLLILSGLFVFSPLVEGGTTHLAVMIIRLLILALFSVTLADWIRRGAVTYPRLPIGPAVALFVALTFLSTLFSPYTHQSLQWLLVLLSYAGLLYLLVTAIRAWDHVATLLAVVVAVGLLQATWALVQAGWFGMLRPTGSFFNPNFLAGYLAAVWTLVFGVLCYACLGQRGRLRQGTVNRIRFLVGLGLLVILFTALAWTGSRGGALAFLAGAALVLGLRFGRKGVGLLLALVVIGLLVPNPVRERLWAEHRANPLTYARLQIWHSSIRQMADHPFGVGLGLYQYLYPRYMFPVEGQIMRYGRVAQTAHNEYLQMGVELGVAGILVFCWGMLAAAREARRALRHRLKRWQRGVVVGVGAAAAGILLHAGVDANLHEPAIAIVLTACVGIILSARRLCGRDAEALRRLPIRSRPMWAILGTVVIAGLVVGVGRMGFAWNAFEDGSRSMAQQDFSQAIAQYRTSVALDPGKALYHSSIASASFRLFQRSGDGGAAQAALAELQSAMALNPLDGRLPGLLGHVYLSLAGSPVPLTPTLSPATRHEPALQNLPADGSRVTDWLRAARAAYARAAELEPFSPFHRLELGRLDLTLGNRDAAESSVREAVDLEPNFLPGRAWLAQLYLDSNRVEAAEREYREIVERQRRYAGWPKAPMEEGFLAVDLRELDDAFQRARPRP